MENTVDLDRLNQWFKDAEDSSSDARAQSERDRDYVDGNQLTDEEVEELKRRGQPAVVMNRVRRKVNWMLGLEAQRRTDPKGFARTQQHQQGADAMTDAIRFVVDNTNFDRIRSMVWANLLIEGYGGCEVIHKEMRGKIEVAINLYHWDRLGYDPHSREADFSDARYLYAVVWMDADDVKAMAPKSIGDIDEMIAKSSSDSDTYDDTPRRTNWVSSDRRRIRVVLMWHREGKTWKWCRFVGPVKIDGGDSPYVDEDGESICPLVLQSLYVGRNGERYGMVRDMISPQDEINKRRSKALWQSTVRQTWGRTGAVASVTKLKRETALANGHIEISGSAEYGTDFGFVPSDNQASTHLALLQEAKFEIDGMAANGVLAGDAGDSASGRAVLARQQGGLIEVAPLMDALGQFSRNVYRHIWWMIRQTWTEERWIRVTDDRRNARFVGINQTITLQQQLKEMPDDQAFAVARQMQLVPNDPRLQMPVGRQNAVDEIDIDIVLEDVPDAVSVQGETFDALVQLAPTIQPQMQAAWMQLLLETAPLRADARDKLLEAIQKAEEQAAPAGGIMQEAQVRKAMAEAFKAENEAGVGGAPGGGEAGGQDPLGIRAA